MLSLSFWIHSVTPFCMMRDHIWSLTYYFRTTLKPHKEFECNTYCAHLHANCRSCIFTSQTKSLRVSCHHKLRTSDSWVILHRASHCPQRGFHDNIEYWLPLAACSCPLEEMDMFQDLFCPLRSVHQSHNWKRWKVEPYSETCRDQAPGRCRSWLSYCEPDPQEWKERKGKATWGDEEKKRRSRWVVVVIAEGKGSPGSWTLLPEWLRTQCSNAHHWGLYRHQPVCLGIMCVSWLKIIWAFDDCRLACEAAP